MCKPPNRDVNTDTTLSSNPQMPFKFHPLHNVSSSFLGQDPNLGSCIMFPYHISLICFNLEYFHTLSYLSWVTAASLPVTVLSSLCSFCLLYENYLKYPITESPCSWQHPIKSKALFPWTIPQIVIKSKSYQSFLTPFY